MVGKYQLFNSWTGMIASINRNRFMIISRFVIRVALQIQDGSQCHLSSTSPAGRTAIGKERKMKSER